MLRSFAVVADSDGRSGLTSYHRFRRSVHIVNSHWTPDRREMRSRQKCHWNKDWTLFVLLWCLQCYSKPCDASGNYCQQDIGVAKFRSCALTATWCKGGKNSMGQTPNSQPYPCHQGNCTGKNACSSQSVHGVLAMPIQSVGVERTNQRVALIGSNQWHRNTQTCTYTTVPKGVKHSCWAEHLIPRTMRLMISSPAVPFAGKWHKYTEHKEVYTLQHSLSKRYSPT